MTNIKQKKERQNVHSHIESAFEFINVWLPQAYVAKVQAKCTNRKVPSTGTIRNVRNRINPREDNYIDIINLLVEVAKDHRADIEKLEKQSI